MLAKDEDLICGIYPKKSVDFEYMFRLARAYPHLTSESPGGCDSLRFCIPRHLIS
jgi:hypothetical protein